MSMRRESRSKAPNSSDLLVCFPSRAHLTLMPKTICSPSRPSEASQSLALSKYNKNKSLLKRARARGSPVLWAKSKSGMGQEMEEPTSPKVTCAGQIRVRPKSGACKNWQSVMEEIERIHKKGRQKKKKPSWLQALGLKKDAMHFLTCLRSLRLDFRCFGAFPAGADVTSDDDDEDEDEDEDEEEEEQNRADDEDEESSRTVFSKWFMVLQDEQKEKEKIRKKDDDDDDDEVGGGACVPPPNALLLMRCRSAPAKSWLEEKAEEEEEEKKKYEDDEREEEKKKENVILMRYDTEYYKISSEIAKETWVVGGMGDVLSRSWSCKR